MTYVLYLDDYHAGDPLFVQGLARELARAGGRMPPCVILHGSGEQAERMLEAEGRFPERLGGVWQVTTDAERALVERAIREANKTLTATLNEAGVPVVGAHGVDRNLLRIHEAGRVEAGRTGWVQALVRQRVVPVLSTLTADEAGVPREAPMAAVAAALAEGLGGAVTVVAFLKSTAPGVKRGGAVLKQIGVEALREVEALPAAGFVERVVHAGMPALLTSLYGFFSEAGPQGTRVDGAPG